MKSILILALLFSCSISFGQNDISFLTESKLGSFENVKSGNEKTLSNSVVLIDNNSAFLGKSQFKFNLEDNYSFLKLDQKLSDYKLKALNCGGQNISSQNLMQNLIIDEFTNHLAKLIINTTFKIH